MAQVWLTTGDQTRLLSREPDIPFATVPDTTSAMIVVDAAMAYQEMIGFGAAISDASAYLINRRLGVQRDAIMHELFGRDSGIGLSFIRTPMGASDFSPTHYSYDDVPPGQADPALARFSIDADRADKLPVIKQAFAINPAVKLVASPWSAPGWMKTSGSLILGSLRPDAYATYAQYLLKFVRAYEAEGVPVFAVTLQNEPAHEPKDYPGMLLDAKARAELTGRHVGPLFARSGATTHILDWDHNWDMPAEPLSVLDDSVAGRYVAGVAWHCYAGDVSAQTRVRAEHPSKDVYFTECAGGDWAPVFADNLKWNVSTLIIGATRNWARGVALWNLALDENGGPHLGGCGNCRGVITINSRTGSVTRNVEYYALAHASKFVRPGARRIASTTDVGKLQTVAFLNVDDGSRVTIVLNTGSTETSFVIRERGRSFGYRIPGGAVASVRWR